METEFNYQTITQETERTITKMLEDGERDQTFEIASKYALGALALWDHLTIGHQNKEDKLRLFLLATENRNSAITIVDEFYKTCPPLLNTVCSPEN